MFVEQKIRNARLSGVESKFSAATFARAELPTQNILLGLALRLRRP
jgi:hypothetical protein